MARKHRTKGLWAVAEGKVEEQQSLGREAGISFVPLAPRLLHH